jgi:hypothetical protein
VEAKVHARRDELGLGQSLHAEAAVEETASLHGAPIQLLDASAMKAESLQYLINLNITFCIHLIPGQTSIPLTSARYQQSLDN